MKCFVLVWSLAILPACAGDDVPFADPSFDGPIHCVGRVCNPLVDDCIGAELDLHACRADEAEFAEKLEAYSEVYFYDPDCSCSQAELDACHAAVLGDAGLASALATLAEFCWQSAL